VRLPDPGVYLITPDWTDTDRLVRVLEPLLDDGVALLQYRNKKADVDAARRQLEVLLPLCRRAGTPLIINDSVSLAVASGADGVHVGRDDGGVAAARAHMPHGIVGASCYNDPMLAQQAEAAGADYVAFGAMFPSTTKPAAVAASPMLLAEAKARGRAAVVAIGGITAERAPALIDAGACYLAVISDIFEADTPLERLRHYRLAFSGNS